MTSSHFLILHHIKPRDNYTIQGVLVESSLPNVEFVYKIHPQEYSLILQGMLCNNVMLCNSCENELVYI